MKEQNEKTEVRLLSIEQASAYISMGKASTRRWMEEIGAVRRFGTRVLFDKKVIDAALDKMGGEE